MVERKPWAFRRTMPVPAGHCPEPIMEIGHTFYAPFRIVWRRCFNWYQSDHGSIMYSCPSSYGVCDYGEHKYGGARIASEFGGKIMENNADLRLPWRLAPLEGKYYGTHILDANGEEVAEFWDHSEPSPPSVREKEYFGSDWTEEKWNEYVCDSHWECERDYVRALAIVTAMNAMEKSNDR